ncbi:glycerophosphotransferase [Sporosarcina sp. NCCP-2716]|uniref:CDP-glycerol glycerophosphotransferase family protein n=1 Tax=Sporosarcina sp. NCCP-2716 TaxID=2943679 RepID=UPI00203CE144|nr:CDP-glycerol glycerophosphotransferase family protein [Sporosarcina sp. NCCP-2716]GKV70033.1 glycerophosphotransferase [Sporosarcina sp. NCCP-2716]
MELKRRRPLQGFTTFIKTAGAYMAAGLLPRVGKKPIILIGGSLGEKYEDNAAAFHEYLTANFRDRYEIYWMYDPDTDYVQEKGIENAVPLGSFRNYLLFFRAAYTVHGHSLMYDIVPGIDKYIFWNKKTTMVHISHGIECFKKILIMPEDVPLLERCDIFNCASRYERHIKRDEWGMPEHKLPVTGMARFDRLPYNTPAKRVRNILLMMTWRETLMDLSEKEFMASDYFRATEGLLKNEQFQRLLSNHNAHLKVVLHPFMKRFEHYFKQLGIDSDRMEFRTFDDMSIREEISQSDMLITDYSSIFWDFVYMNRPVIFFTFDQEDFLKMRGSYLDLDNDLLGYKADTSAGVADALSTILDDHKPGNPRFSELSEYVDFTDGKNCERLAYYMFTHGRR